MIAAENRILIEARIRPINNRHLCKRKLEARPLGVESCTHRIPDQSSVVNKLQLILTERTITHMHLLQVLGPPAVLALPSPCGCAARAA